MKKVLGLILMALAITMLFVSCDDPIHEHSYSDEWKSDATNHWHECECGDKKDIAAHTFGENTVKDGKVVQICSVCEYSKEVEDTAVTVTDEASIKAASEASDVKTIKLANDIEIKTVEIKVTKPLIIDMNNKVLKLSGAGSITLADGATITVKNIPEKMEGAINVNNAVAATADYPTEYTYYTDLAKAIENVGSKEAVVLVSEVTLNEDDAFNVNKAIFLELTDKLIKGASNIKIVENGSINVLYAAEGQECFGGAEAKIGAPTSFDGIYYSSLATAVASAKDEDTITLLEDMALKEIITVTKTIVLNMNEKTISLDAGDTSAGQINVKKNGNLTVSGNGKTTFTNNYYKNGEKPGISGYIFNVFDDAVLTIEDGDYYGCMGVVQAGTKDVKTEQYKVNVKSGKFKSCVQDGNPKRYWTLNKFNGTTGNILVSGGSFVDFNPSNPSTDDDTSYLANGYKVTQETKESKTIYTVSQETTV